MARKMSKQRNKDQFSSTSLDSERNRSARLQPNFQMETSASSKLFQRMSLASPHLSLYKSKQKNEPSLKLNASEYFYKPESHIQEQSVDESNLSSIDYMAGNFKHPMELNEDDYMGMEVEEKEPNSNELRVSNSHTPLGSFVQI